MKNTIELTLEQAKELHAILKSDTDIAKEIEDKFPELRPKKITDLVTDMVSVNNYERSEGIDISIHEIYSSTSDNKKANIAFAALSRLAFVLNEGWEPDWKDKHEEKWSIYYRGSQFTATYCTECRGGLIYFKSIELAKHALKHNEQIFKDLFKVK